MQLHYERRGDGPPLVLIHGIGHRWQAWEPVMDRLAEVHDVVAIDLPGFGASPFEGGYDVAGAVERLAACFVELGVERPHVAGNSLGGLLALEAAKAGYVATATAISPAGMWNRRQRAYSMAMVAVIRFMTSFPTPVVRFCLRTPARRRLSCGLLNGRPDMVDPETLLSDAVSFRAAPGFWPTFRQGLHYSYQAQPISVPVTIAWGTKDRILPQGQARRARRLVPEARWVDLPGLGHIPMVEDPELVSRTILDTCAVAGKK